jgi:uncharacterized SAM-binding protein YcdF (DUF218 family)
VRFVGFLRRHRVLTALALVVLGTLATLVTTAAAVWGAAHNDEARRVDHVDVIAVLGAAEYTGRPSLVFQGRLGHAELLYRRGFASMVVVLGGGRTGDITTEAEAGRQWLIGEGLPETRVFAQPTGNDTLQSLEGAARFMRSHGLSTVFLVSDPWHNLRIRRMARDLGITAYVSATWHSAARSQWTRLSGYSRETFAYLYYRVFHR